MVKVLVPMDMYNAFRECEQGDETSIRNVGARVHPFMRPLVEGLAKKHPTWHFVSRNYGESVNGNYYQYSKFTIMEHGEELGWVNREKHWRTHEESYTFDGPRMRSKRSRGNYTRTKDLKKALKLINTDVYGRTLAERAESARELGPRKAFSAAYRVKATYEREALILQNPLVQFALDNWDTFAARTPENAQHARAMAALKDGYEANRGTAPISESVAHKKGVTVLEVRDAYYALPDRVPDAIQPYTLDTLPEKLKLGVAMLKLVEDDTLVAGIGVRVDRSTYYIADGELDEQQP